MVNSTNVLYINKKVIVVNSVHHGMKKLSGRSRTSLCVSVCMYVFIHKTKKVEAVIIRLGILL